MIIYCNNAIGLFNKKEKDMRDKRIKGVVSIAGFSFIAVVFFAFGWKIFSMIFFAIGMFTFSCVVGKHLFWVNSEKLSRLREDEKDDFFELSFRRMYGDDVGIVRLRLQYKMVVIVISLLLTLDLSLWLHSYM